MAVTLSEPLIAGLLSQPRFVAAVPEFRGLVPVPKVAKKRCSSCGRTVATAVTNVRVRAFAAVVQSLSQDGVDRLKKYIGTDYIQFYRDNQLVQL